MDLDLIRRIFITKYKKLGNYEANLELHTIEGEYVPVRLVLPNKECVKYLKDEGYDSLKIGKRVGYYTLRYPMDLADWFVQVKAMLSQYHWNAERQAYVSEA